MKTDTNPIYFAAAGCLLGVVIMVGLVTMMTLAGSSFLPLSGNTLQTVINVGAWVLPLGLGVLGYAWAKNRQKK